MNWIKRNWYEIGLWLILAMMAVGLYHDVLIANAQKPEPQKNWRGETREAYCKANPGGIYSEGNGDMASICPQPTIPIFDRDVFDDMDLESWYKQNQGWSATCIYFDGEAKQIGPNYEIASCFPQIGDYVEKHCVAVLTEKHTVHHKLDSGTTNPHFDDRMEWDDDIPEQTLRLRCSDKEK